MRLALRRTIFTIMLLCASAIMLTVAVAGAALPAHGAAVLRVLTVSHVYETNNSTVYLTTDGTLPYGAAETGAAPGRDITFSDTGHTYVDPNGLCGTSGCEVYHMVLNSGYCIAPDNTYVFVEVRDCSNFRVNWAVKASSIVTDALIINTAASDSIGTDQYLAGDRNTGFQLELCGNAGISCGGLYTNWSG